jgi:hypothetical protein
MSSRFLPCHAEGARFASYQNVAFVVWAQKQRGLTQALAKKTALVSHLAAQHPEGVVLFVVITQGNPIPDSNTRKELESFYATWAKTWRAVVFVAEGNDLWSVTARSVMTALRLVQHRPYPTRIFSETSEAASLAAELCTKLPGQSHADAQRAIMEMVEELRRMPT